MFRLSDALACTGIALLLPLPAVALEVACSPIIKASNAKFAAPAFHDKMYESATATTPHGEFIKVGDKAWMKAGNDWVSVPPAMLKKMQNFDPDGFGLHNCKSLGMIGIRPAKIYSWDLKVAGKVYKGSKLTVAFEGLPTKTETGDGAYTLTIYNGVAVPKGAK
jgi:hypothetical protein